MGYEIERLVTVGTYTSPWEAQLARARLEAEGIESMVADEHVVRLDWAISNAVGGVKLRVREEDAERATAALQADVALPEIYLVTEDEATLPRCPACNSEKLSFERWSRIAFFGTWLLFGFPVPIPRKRWTCRHCGADWREEELRGELGPKPAGTADAEPPESLEANPALVTVARFPTPWEAHLARTRLEAAGLEACVLEERLPVVNLLLGGLAALNRVAVHAADAERALEILEESAELSADGDL